MDKSKLGVIAVLLVLGGALYLSKAPPAPSPADPNAAGHSEGDGHDHGATAANTTESSPADADVAGGVTELKVEDVRAGTGATAQDGDTLTMNYKGSLLSGKVFDQSYGKAPFVFPLGAGRVIKGWDEGIKGMKVGGKRKLTIPADLGYGDAGAGADIPPGATLLFDVELLKVEKKSG